MTLSYPTSAAFPTTSPSPYYYHRPTSHSPDTLDSLNMPQVRIDRDDASISSAASFSTAYDLPAGPPRPLRRRNTVTTLKRWASKRVSRPLSNNTNVNELSEKNLIVLDQATQFSEAKSDALVQDRSISGKMAVRNSFVKGSEFLHRVSGTGPSLHPIQLEKDPYLMPEYDVFCHQFTLSGTPQMKKEFDISMEAERGEQATNACSYLANQNHIPTTSHLAEESGSLCGNFDYQPEIIHAPSVESKEKDLVLNDPSFVSSRHNILPTLYDKSQSEEKVASFSTNQDIQPQPPSQVMTPLIYMEMQRATRERRLSRQRSIFQPLRSLFSNTPADK